MSQENTYTKDVTFISKVLNEETNAWVDGKETKTITFKDFSRTDKSQHKLHFMLVAIFNSSEEAEGLSRIDSDKMYDVTVKAVKTLAIIDANFTEQNKAELLNDSGALFPLGIWLLKEKITPFFSVLMSNGV